VRIACVISIIFQAASPSRTVNNRCRT